MPNGVVRAALEVVAAANLNSRPGASVELRRESEPEFLDAVSRERLTGLALAAVDAGSLALTDAAIDDLIKRHEDQLALDLRLELLLLEATAVLDDHGISYRALKGPVLAHTVYSDPSLRSFGDIDLLIEASRFDLAINALRTLGFERRFIEPRAGFDARFTKGACVERADGLEVDLHRTLAPGAFGVRVAQHDFFARSGQTITLGGARVAGIDPEHAFVHACFHAVLGDSPPRLVPIRDIVECYLSVIDEQIVMAMAASVRCEVVFREAIGLVESTLDVHLIGPLASWARRYEPTGFDRWALRSYTGVNRSYSRQLVASFCALAGVRDRVSYAAALAFPSRTYVRAREGSYAARLMRGTRELRDGALQ